MIIHSLIITIDNNFCLLYQKRATNMQKKYYEISLKIMIVYTHMYLMSTYLSYIHHMTFLE